MLTLQLNASTTCSEWVEWRAIWKVRPSDDRTDGSGIASGVAGGDW